MGEDTASQPSVGLPKRTAAGRRSQADFRQCDDLLRGQEWRWQRSVAAPLFRHDELLQYGPIMTAARGHRCQVAQGSAGHGSCHQPRHDAGRLSRDLQHHAGGGAEDVIDAIETGHADYYDSVNWWVMYTLLNLPHCCRGPATTDAAHETRIREAVVELVRARRATAADGNDLMAACCARPIRNRPDHVGPAPGQQYHRVPRRRL